MFNAQAMRAKREHDGISQAEAARRAAVSYSQYRNIEKLRSEPTASLVGRLARALDMEPNDLITVPPPDAADS